MSLTRSMTVFIAAGVLVLAGCDGSSTKSSSPTLSTSGSTAASTNSSAPLTKTEFLAKMNKVCSDTNTQVGKLPEPAGSTDFANVITNLTGTIKLFPAFLTQIDVLVAQSPDATELQTKWVGPERSELGNFAAAAQKVIADAQAKDSVKIEADVQVLNAANSNSKTIASYLTSYGLTECANLEDN